jgi:predicted amidohydrolase
VKVAGLQADLVWEDAQANRAAFEPRVRAAAESGAELVVLPEMWPTGFSMAPGRVAEAPGGPSETWMAGLAAETGAALCGSIAQRDAGETLARNVHVLVRPDGERVRYAKVHPFSYGGESEHYAAGDAAVTLEVAGVRVTPLVCYDLRFPELFAPLAARTDLFVVVANWPAPRIAHWDALIAARAIETQAYVLGVNRVGNGGGLYYVGSSRLIDPVGEEIALDVPGEPCDVAGEVDPAVVAEVRAEFPFLADRRPDIYGSL